MTAAVAREALSAPQGAPQGPDPLGTRNHARSAVYGARRPSLRAFAPSLIGLAPGAPRMALGDTHSRELAFRVPKHAKPSAGASVALLTTSVGNGESEP